MGGKGVSRCNLITFGSAAAPRNPARRRHIGDIVSENWRQERDRIVELLRSIERGETTYFDHPGRRELQAANPENVADLQKRVATLNSRLGEA